LGNYGRVSKRARIVNMNRPAAMILTTTPGFDMAQSRLD